MPTNSIQGEYAMKAGRPRSTLLLYSIVMILAACASQSYIYEGGRKFSKKQFDTDMQIYQHYRDLNTLEGYHEFLENHPKNIFRARARDELDLLEFKPYEKKDTVEGYLEFKMLYPGNPYIDKANWHIEQVEIKRYDGLDTTEGYREFLHKYPRSIFADSARERLQELAFREQDKLLRERCGFDLLKYRHGVRKIGNAGGALQDFEIFVQVRPDNGRDCFVTSLLYSTPPDLNEEAQREELEAEVLGVLLGLIAEQAKSGARVPPPVFEVCFAPKGLHETATLMLSYAVIPNGLQLLTTGRNQARELVNLTHAAPAPAPLPEPSPVKSYAQTAAGTQAFAASEETQPGPAPVVIYAQPTDPAGVMRAVADSNSFTDAVLSRRWETTYSDGGTKAIAVIEKQRRYSPQETVRCATVLRYLETIHTRSDARNCAAAILHQRTLKSGDRYWYIMRRGDAGRTLTIETYRPAAENNFFLEQYIDLLPESETHEFLETVTHDGRPAVLIRSTPIKKSPYYAWRRSMIDLERMVPLMIEYYDNGNALQKDVTLSWKQSFGVWYWDVAMLRNLADGSTTRITTTDIRINLGLPDSDFQATALSRLTGR